MQSGTEYDPNILIEVLQNKLSQAVIREAQMEAAIQSLMVKNQTLEAQIPKDTEGAEDAKADQSE